MQDERWQPNIRRWALSQYPARSITEIMQIVQMKYPRLGTAGRWDIMGALLQAETAAQLNASKKKEG